MALCYKFEFYKYNNSIQLCGVDAYAFVFSSNVSCFFKIRITTILQCIKTILCLLDTKIL